MDLSAYDQGLVQAYRDAYRAAGGALHEDDLDVLDTLRAAGVVTARHAEIVGRGQAMTDRAGDDDA